MRLKVGLFVVEGGHAAMIESGETVVVVRATKVERKERIVSPSVLVDYDERPYGRGEIPDGILRQSPSAKVQFISRLIESSIRPLITANFTKDIKIVATTLSMDEDVPTDILAVTGSSMAAGLVNSPCSKYASVRVGLVGNDFIINPTYSQIKESALDLVLAGTEDGGVLMMEVGANQLSVEGIIAAVTLGHKAIVDLISAQNEMLTEVGIKEDVGDIVLPVVDTELYRFIEEHAEGKILESFAIHEKMARDDMIEEIREEVELFIRNLPEDEDLRLMVESDGALFGSMFNLLIKKTWHKGITAERLRPDGREPDEVRTVSCQVGVLPNRVHGSALFTVGSRDAIIGVTQVLSTVTLGKAGDSPELPDNSLPQDEKPSFSHITFPPPSAGKSKDTGYAAFVERALLPVIPKKSDEFPFVIRMVSEVLSSNGSTSVSCVCASTLSLMDAGVPITKPVSAVVMALFFAGGNWKSILITDCDGLEDDLGDVVIKVAGTDTGITAVQMEMKTQNVLTGIPVEVIKDVLEQSTQARKNTLENMLRVIDKPRPYLKANAMENAPAFSEK